MVVKRTKDLMGCLLCSSRGYTPTTGLPWSWEAQSRADELLFCALPFVYLGSEAELGTLLPLASQKVSAFWVHDGQDTGIDGDLQGGRLCRNKAEWVCTQLC